MTHRQVIEVGTARLTLRVLIFVFVFVFAVVKYLCEADLLHTG